MLNALSVDVEDYFQVQNFARRLPRAEWPRMESRVVANTERLAALFAAQGVHATFFVLGCVAREHPDLVRRLASAGHEIASHGMSHTLLTGLSRAAFREEARESRTLLQDLSGQAVRGFRAPSFTVVESTQWALDELLAAGYSWDSSIFPVKHPDYGMPSAGDSIHVIRTAGDSTLTEFPMSVARFLGVPMPVSGGGYFRLLPWCVTRWGLRRIQKQRPFVFYLHPWEVDPDQPDMRAYASRFGAFRHYCGLARTLPRLKKLLESFELGTVSACIERAEVRQGA